MVLDTVVSEGTEENVFTLSTLVGLTYGPSSEGVLAYTVFVVKYVLRPRQVVWFCQIKAEILRLLKIKNETVGHVLGNHCPHTCSM